MTIRKYLHVSKIKVISVMTNMSLTCYADPHITWRLCAASISLKYYPKLFSPVEYFIIIICHVPVLIAFYLNS